MSLVRCSCVCFRREVCSPTIPAVDPDLRKYRRKEMLSAVSKRYRTSGLAPLTTKADAKISKPLVSSDSESEADDYREDELDPDLIAAMEESLQDQEVRELQQAIEASKSTSSASTMVADIYWSNQGASSSRSRVEGVSSTEPHATPAVPVDENDSDDDLYASHSRLETALAIAGASPKKQSSTAIADDVSFFGTPSLLISAESASDTTSGQISQPNDSTASDDPDDEMEEVPVFTTPPTIPRSSISRTSPEPPADQYTSTLPVVIDVDEDEDDMVEVPVVPSILQPRTYDIHSSLGITSHRPPQEPFSDVLESASTMIDGIAGDPSSPTLVDHTRADPPTTLTAGVTTRSYITADISTQPAVANEELSESDSDAHWSSPDPAAVDALPKVTEESWDAAQEMDPQAEEGEYARFMAQVRGRKLDDVRQEIDDEIKALNKQRKIAMRDSEDITQQMISQIMVSAQCVYCAGRSSVLTSEKQTSSDDAALVRYSIHHCTHGGRSAVRRAPHARARRRDHHRRFGRVPVRRPPRVEEYVQSIQDCGVFPPI